RVVENMTCEPSPAATPPVCQLTVTCAFWPSGTSVAAAGEVNANTSAETLTGAVASRPSPDTVIVSRPLADAVTLNDPPPEPLVVSVVADSVLPVADATLTSVLAMPVPAAFCSTTVQGPVSLSGRLGGQFSVSVEPM